MLFDFPHKFYLEPTTDLKLLDSFLATSLISKTEELFIIDHSQLGRSKLYNFLLGLSFINSHIALDKYQLIVNSYQNQSFFAAEPRLYSNSTHFLNLYLQSGFYSEKFTSLRWTQIVQQLRNFTLNTEIIFYDDFSNELYYIKIHPNLSLRFKSFYQIFLEQTKQTQQLDFDYSLCDFNSTPELLRKSLSPHKIWNIKSKFNVIKFPHLRYRCNPNC